MYHLVNVYSRFSFGSERVNCHRLYVISFQKFYGFTHGKWDYRTILALRGFSNEGILKGMYFHSLTTIIGFQPSAYERQSLNSNCRTWEVRPEYTRERIICNVSRSPKWWSTRSMRDILQICKVTLQCVYYTQNDLDNACSDQAYWPVQNLCNYWTKHGQSQG